MNLSEMARQGNPGIPPGPATAPAGGKKPATPEQQAQFDMLLGRARTIMGESGAEWKAAMGIDPAGAAVKMGTQTLRFLAMESEKAGQPVDPIVLLHVGMQLVKDIAGVANDAGLVPDEQLEPFLQRVMQESMAEYMRLDAEDGLLPRPEDLQQRGRPKPSEAATKPVAQGGFPARMAGPQGGAR